ncbi:hypothetical protein DOTSEDRAFT_68522 [Dothistroma septosporum NZE10]|uniref:Uncharacterized protein n=1 Tax=Dothistroma septosporum (strain NZE10 / CBS 128990) TaxID=675120 RepID=N1Q1Y6_DOTSN|nr:hypothetical protein DOTSEDRAFT_68522 [Dothistroma septosporum NZE10]
MSIHGHIVTGGTIKKQNRSYGRSRSARPAGMSRAIPPSRPRAATIGPARRYHIAMHAVD